MTTPLPRLPNQVPAADANRHFSKLLGRVRSGERIVITVRGKAVAELVPAIDDSEETRRYQEARRALFARLDSQPRHPIEPWTRDELYDD